MKTTTLAQRASIAIALCAFAGAASAQDVPQTPPAATAASPFESERAEARERNRVARELFERQNFDGALAEFRRLYELLAGSPMQPRVLFNIAQCEEQLGRYDDAMVSYRRYLDALGDGAPNRDEVLGTLRTLENLLGTIQIESNVPRAEVWVDDRRVGTAPGTVRVAGGRHVVQLRAPGHVPSQQEVQLAGRATRALRFTLERIAVSRGLAPGYFWAAVGATAAVLGAGAVCGGLAMSQDADARARLADPAQRFTVTEVLRDDIRGLALAADILYGTAAAMAVGAGVLFALTDFRSRPAERAPRARGGLVPWREGSAVGLAVAGAF